MSTRAPFLFSALSLLTCLALLIGGCPPAADPNDANEPNEPNEPNDSNSPVEKSLHEKIFTELLDGFSGPSDCLLCHGGAANELLQTGHWRWAGQTENIVGLEGETHGKRDLINNFCLAVPSNEGRCSQCHPSFGWKNDEFDFESTDSVDCLICHDTTNTYRKHPNANGGGGPPSMMVEGVDTVVTAEELQNVAYNVGQPNRKNCGFCHFYAGGGDNVKHPDLSSDMGAPTAELDVHMGGQGFQCQTCHTAEHHGIAGMPLHSVDEGGKSPHCERCHTEEPHERTPILSGLLNGHTARVACVTCHIPALARSKPTKLEWYWSKAGDSDRTPVLDEYGKPDYDKMKGEFVWGKNVTPVYRWFNGQWTRRVINVSDTYENAGTPEDPVVIAEPQGSIDDPTAKIYPFKRFIGDQPADTVQKRLLVPHLFGQAAGPNAYWVKYDWGAALAEGTAYAGQPYSGTFGFAHTVMYLTVNHEIAPADQALSCQSCHGVEGFFESLGYEADPLGD